MTQQKSIGIYLTSMTMGGAERVALNLSSGLVDYGYDVDLVLVNATGSLLDDVPEEVSIVDLAAGRVLKSVRPLQGYLSNREPDVLYSMMTEPNLIAIAAQRLANAGSRLVISEHNMLSRSAETTKDQIIHAGAWALYPLADEVVAVSKGVRDDLVANTRLDTNSISVIYNPVDIEWIHGLATKPVDHRWIMDESLKVVIAGGRHEPQKGFDTLLNAFSRLERNDVRLILFGTGPETESLEGLAQSAGIADQVDFVGFVENPYKLMAHADLFVLSSEYEGFGLVLIEALACGCPIVSTDCESGPREILKNGLYGELVPVGDSGALSEMMSSTLARTHDSNRLKRRADHFNIEAAISQYNSIF